MEYNFPEDGKSFPYETYVPVKEGMSPGGGGVLDYLRLLKYQYAVTLGIYALTWSESIIMNTIFFYLTFLAIRYSIAIIMSVINVF